MKTRLDEFWRALIKILLFGPLCSPWKKMNTNRQSLTNCTNFAGDGDFFIYEYNLCVWWLNHTRASFFSCFFLQKIKRMAPCEKWCGFYFFLFCCKKTLTQTDAIPSSRVFIQHALNIYKRSSERAMLYTMKINPIQFILVLP